ncbi:ribosomal protein S5 domain 2-like protein [Calocera cornea HHB12733]|uniref:Ribosomal protein S5 domain 2-like protein n=1 Tax=Calocera cornea HHB12733 TaxID=1353952 RepID=A0A165JDG3_9BASI|nr:ribosomal protein S5 domain 2-like protein [Calocera cornea HHB12733]
MSTLINFDRRRVNGPEKSAPPLYFDDDDDDDEVEEEDAQPSSARPSPSQRVGRAPSSVRPIFLETGLIPSAPGSAYLEQALTKLVCAVYGPRQLKSAVSMSSERGTLSVSLKYAPFATPARKAPLRDAEDRRLSLRVRAALAPAVRAESFPKAGVDVFVHVLQGDGEDALVCAAVMAASAALADAGVEMLGLVVGCCAVRVGLPGTGPRWLDPCEEEQRRARGGVGVTCLPALGTVADLWQWGELSLDEVDEMADECRSKCDELHHVAVKVLLESAKRRLGRS